MDNVLLGILLVRWRYIAAGDMPLGIHTSFVSVQELKNNLFFYSSKHKKFSRFDKIRMKWGKENRFLGMGWGYILLFVQAFLSCFEDKIFIALPHNQK